MPPAAQDLSTSLTLILMSTMWLIYKSEMYVGATIILVSAQSASTCVFLCTCQNNEFNLLVRDFGSETLTLLFHCILALPGCSTYLISIIIMRFWTDIITTFVDICRWAHGLVTWWWSITTRISHQIYSYYWRLSALLSPSVRPSLCYICAAP